MTTPGPWTVGGPTGFKIQLAIDPSIGCAYGAGEEVIANARLIAAAPELLAFAQEFIRLWCAGEVITYDLQMQATAAIAKAAS